MQENVLLGYKLKFGYIFCIDSVAYGSRDLQIAHQSLRKYVGTNAKAFDYKILKIMVSVRVFLHLLSLPR
jgi:hypothetical protein